MPLQIGVKLAQWQHYLSFLTPIFFTTLSLGRRGIVNHHTAAFGFKLLIVQNSGAKDSCSFKLLLGHTVFVFLFVFLSEHLNICCLGERNCRSVYISMEYFCRLNTWLVSCFPNCLSSWGCFSFQ
jgi:hypothetical protein